MSGIIRETRESLGLTMRELADRLGVSQGSVSVMERNDISGVIKVNTRDRALAALGFRTETVLKPLDDNENVPITEKENSNDEH